MKHHLARSALFAILLTCACNKPARNPAPPLNGPNGETIVVALTKGECHQLGGVVVGPVEACTVTKSACRITTKNERTGKTETHGACIDEVSPRK